MTTAVIAFREFFEAFLIAGVFLGVSKKLKLRKEFEIGLAIAVGLLLSFLLIFVMYAFGDNARAILTKRNADILESYLLIFSGVFISYVVCSLHGTVHKGGGKSVLLAHMKLQQRTFDLSLFITIVFLVFREGFEIALFTASVALLSTFIQNIIGVLIGFDVAVVLGLITRLVYIQFPIGKIFKATEGIIILLGAIFVQTGVEKLGGSILLRSVIVLIYIVVVLFFMKRINGIKYEYPDEPTASLSQSTR